MAWKTADVSQRCSYVIYSDEFSVNLHFPCKNEHFLAKIRRILVFECVGTNHIEIKQTSPMPCIGQISAYIGMISWSHDGFNRMYSLFIVPNQMTRRVPPGAVKQMQPLTVTFISQTQSISRSGQEKKNMCVYYCMEKWNRVGRSENVFILLKVFIWG